MSTFLRTRWRRCSSSSADCSPSPDSAASAGSSGATAADLRVALRARLARFLAGFFSCSSSGVSSGCAAALSSGSSAGAAVVSLAGASATAAAFATASSTWPASSRERELCALFFRPMSLSCATSSREESPSCLAREYTRVLSLSWLRSRFWAKDAAALRLSVVS